LAADSGTVKKASRGRVGQCASLSPPRSPNGAIAIATASLAWGQRVQSCFQCANLQAVSFRHAVHHAPVAAVSKPGDDDGLMRISRLPAPLVRQQGGVTKDWVVLLDEDQPRPVAWRVHARFAGYLIGRLATLIDDPSALATLENRLDGEHFTMEARTLFSDIIRTARGHASRQEATRPLPPEHNGDA